MLFTSAEGRGNTFSCSTPIGESEAGGAAVFDPLAGEHRMCA